MYPTPGEPYSTARKWWAPAPAPELPPLSTKRAYTEVLFVFSAFFLTGIVAAGLLLANRYKDVLSGASWSVYVPQAIDALMQCGLAVAVVVLFAQRRGVSWDALGVRMPRDERGRVASGMTVRILAWALLAQVVGGIVNAVLQTGHLPTTTPSAPELVFATADSVQAGVVEEFVVLAFVVVTLRQARRPLWEITLVALVLRGSYHIYYGPGVAGIIVWAALFYWIYLRFQTLLPLVVAHAGWDAVGFLSQRWTAVAGVAILVTAAIWIAAPITWLVERGDRQRRLQLGAWAGGGWTGGGGWAGWSPPGWHPDPSGVHHWRWWDGYRWTDHVSGP